MNTQRVKLLIYIIIIKEYMEFLIFELYELCELFYSSYVCMGMCEKFSRSIVLFGQELFELHIIFFSIVNYDTALNKSLLTHNHC